MSFSLTSDKVVVWPRDVAITKCSLPATTFLSRPMAASTVFDEMSDTLGSGPRRLMSDWISSYNAGGVTPRATPIDSAASMP